MSDTGAVLMVADLGDDAGLGHLARSSALGAALLARGVAVRALGHEGPAVIERDGIAWQPERSAARIAEAAAEHSVVVLDSYRLPAASIDAIAASARLVVMLDRGESHPEAALVIAPSDPEPSRPGRLNGLEYALLGRGFRELPARAPVALVETVLVTTGGGDPGGRAAELAVLAQRALAPARVVLVRGPHANHSTAPPGVEAVGPLQTLVEALATADLVVCGAGGTMVEACAAGVPAAVSVLAPNQEPIAEALERAGAVVRLDRTADPEAALRALGHDPARRAELARAARAAVDGRGAERVAATVERLLN